MDKTNEPTDKNVKTYKVDYTNKKGVTKQYTRKYITGQGSAKPGRAPSKKGIILKLVNSDNLNDNDKDNIINFIKELIEDNKGQ